MVRSCLVVAALCSAVVAVPGAVASRGASASRSAWDAAQQRAVVQAGLMRPLLDGRFHGERPLTGGQVDDTLLQLGFRLGVPAIATGARFVSVADFDRLVVRQLGLSDVAAAVRAEASRAGLAPPRYFGTEVVARILGLRFNHPFPQGESLELYPWDHITRAEAAWSEAVVLGWDPTLPWETQGVRDALATFSLPDYTPAQRAVLRTAVSKIGMPYVWGGESDGPSYGQVHGGYDCSGLVYRAYASRGLPRLTAAGYAGAIPKRARLRFDQLRPADVVFFGSAKRWSRATESSITHTALVLGNGWLIQASDQGVAVAPLSPDGGFAWGRRVL